VSEGPPLLRVRGLTKRYGARLGCLDVGFDLWPGEVLGIVGESGSGKTTVLACVSGRLVPSGGSVELTRRDGQTADLLALPEADRRRLARTDWGCVYQNPRDGLRLGVTAGANVGERLMAVGARHYGEIRAAALDWLGRVEIATDRIDDLPTTFSGGMQQRLQIARCLAQEPSVLLMDEPFGALDAMTRQSLQDELLRIIQASRTTALFVTHDLEEAIYLGDRVVALHPNPGRIAQIFEVTLPRPRNQLETREDPEFIRLRHEIFHFISAGAA
jgi:putative phosphonate transport system ATP-binding protein